MLAPVWLVAIGSATGLITRTIVGGTAYGRVADGLLGITGAFAVDWLSGALAKTQMSWADSTLLIIWGAVAPPLLVHLLARRQAARRFHDAPLRP